MTNQGIRPKTHPVTIAATFSPDTEAFILRLLHILGMVGQVLRARLPAPGAESPEDARTREIELLCQALEALTARVRATKAAHAAADYGEWPEDGAPWPAEAAFQPAETPGAKRHQDTTRQALRFKRQPAPPEPLPRSRKIPLPANHETRPFRYEFVMKCLLRCGGLPRDALQRLPFRIQPEPERGAARIRSQPCGITACEQRRFRVVVSFRAGCNRPTAKAGTA